jgi:hypothetical protein
MNGSVSHNAHSEIDFTACRLADAEIVSVRASGGDLQVEYRDWQENLQKLIFIETVGYEAFSPEGVSLSHGTVKRADPLIDAACKAAGETAASGFSVFSFVSAWNGSEVLRVAAKTAGTSPR